MNQLANPTTNLLVPIWRKLFTLIFLICLLLCAASASAQLVINEFMADPATDWDGDSEYNFKTDEWIEIANTSGESVDLNNYWLTDSNIDQPRFQLSGILQPNAVIVFYGSQVVLWQQNNSVSTTGFSLNNGGDTINLLYKPDSSTTYTTTDTYTYPDHTAEDDRSCGLCPETATWILYDALNPYTGTEPPLTTTATPTPGLTNTSAPLPAFDTVPFGHVKASYK